MESPRRFKRNMPLSFEDAARVHALAVELGLDEKKLIEEAVDIGLDLLIEKKRRKTK